MPSKVLLLAIALTLGSAAATLAQAPTIPEYVARAVAAPARPAADVDRDAARKPAQVIAFAGLKPGDKIADFIPGQGYFTRLFSGVVGPTGHVYAFVPPVLLQVAPKAGDAVKAIAADPAFANVTVVSDARPGGLAPEPLDMVWTSQNYHDMYGFNGAEAAAHTDAAIFRALKPGGVFIVIDHVATAGTSDTAPTTLHRIDPETVKAQVLAAGFTLEAESDLLRNPADTHALKVFDPAIRGHTDQFIMKFRKPG